ncbi:MAG: beta-lactamase domain protein [Chitinophagaceae bacterium]|jgi:phosphoribosyl 1,2-cyclic phosphodiesterase|nr:beta-lactamase domain protein [Chitinophagaceae bacterium]
MSLQVASLNSGSNGNCYYVGNEKEAILVDAGLSCREIEKRLNRLELDMAKIKAIFISHEHTDHIKGVELLSSKHRLPVYITDATRRHGRIKLDKQLSRTFAGNAPIDIGSIRVSAFSKLHDAADPYSFLVSCNNVNVGVFTDIGAPCSNLVQHFSQCHAAFLESNYDEFMLQHGGYPFHLKKRITGGKGHLSNAQALEVFRQHRPSFMTHLFLSHLSSNNNRPELVQEMFDAHAGEVKMVIASRYNESEIYYIKGNDYPLPVKPKKSTPSQLQFSF